MFNKLRKKPKHVRDNIAFSIAGGFTLTVALAWFFVGFQGSPKSVETAEKESNGAFTTLIDQIQEQVATAKESVKDDGENEAVPSVTGEWGLSAQNATSTEAQMQNRLQKEASIMIITSSSTSGASSTASTSVLY